MIKVLVVDDSALIRKLFGRVLSEDPAFSVGFARNGLEALAQLESFKPDVITLDVQMPQMGGLECLDRIMVQRPCPVVMISSLTTDGAEATLEALRLGAVDFVPKPTGAVSLRMQEFAPTLKDKVRAAATAKLPASQRLRERVRFKTAGAAARAPRSTPKPSSDALIVPAQGDGIVLVGTSTGGPTALEALLVPLPSSFCWPIVIAQHMPAAFTGALAKRLDKICALRVEEVSAPMPLQPGCVYIGRGDADVLISRRPSGLVVLSAPATARHLWHPSTDRLVRSAMEQVPAAQLIGVLMTGMGNDGAEAMGALRQGGGVTIAESEETAVVWGMPGELTRAGGASFVLALPMIAARLQRLVPDAARP